MKYFDNSLTLEELKKQYRELATIHHPDCGGDIETMKAINNEYDEFIQIIKNEIETEDTTFNTANEKNTAPAQQFNETFYEEPENFFEKLIDGFFSLFTPKNAKRFVIICTAAVVLLFAVHGRNSVESGDSIESGSESESPFALVLECNYRHMGDRLRSYLYITLPGNETHNVSFTRVENDFFLTPGIPGFIGNAVNVRINANFEAARLVFELDSLLYDTRGAGFDPEIYFWNLETQWLYQVNDWRGDLSGTIAPFTQRSDFSPEGNNILFIDLCPDGWANHFPRGTHGTFIVIDSTARFNALRRWG